MCDCVCVCGGVMGKPHELLVCWCRKLRLRRSTGLVLGCITGCSPPSLIQPIPPPCARRSTYADGLCSLRLREPCEWEGVAYEAVGDVQRVPLLSGAHCLSAGRPKSL